MACDWQDAPAMVRTLAPLRLRALTVEFGDGAPNTPEWLPGGLERVAPFAASLADAALQPALSQVVVAGAGTQRPEVRALLDALVNAVLARRLRVLRLIRCTPPAAAPLARLLAGGTLAELQIQSVVQPEDAPWTSCTWKATLP
jgi:hypothetical protein